MRRSETPVSFSFGVLTRRGNPSNLQFTLSCPVWVLVQVVHDDDSMGPCSIICWKGLVSGTDLVKTRRVSTIGSRNRCSTRFTYFDSDKWSRLFSLMSHPFSPEITTKVIFFMKIVLHLRYFCLETQVKNQQVTTQKLRIMEQQVIINNSFT